MKVYSPDTGETTDNLGLAPRVSSNLTTLTWPLYDATCSGVTPWNSIQIQNIF